MAVLLCSQNCKSLQSLPSEINKMYLKNKSQSNQILINKKEEKLKKE